MGSDGCEAEREGSHDGHYQNPFGAFMECPEALSGWIIPEDGLMSWLLMANTCGDFFVYANWSIQ